MFLRALGLVAALTMTIKAAKFTPDVLLSAPRRSSGVPNSDGSKVLYQISTYSFAEHKWTREIRALNAETKESTLVTATAGASDPKWIGDGDVLLLIPGKDGSTDLVVGKVDDFDKSKYTAGTVCASAENLKIASLDKGNYAVAFSASTKPDGTLFNPEKEPKKHTSGKLYNSLFVRHWDTLVTSNKNAIWTGSLNSASGNLSSTGGKYKLSSVENALKGTGLESPIPPFGGGDNFDISSGGLAFVAKDPELNLATHTKQNLYLALRSSTNSSGFALSKAQKVPLAPGFQGATTNPVFSPDGVSIAFTSMREDGYESDKNQLLLITDVKRPGWISYFFTSKDGKGRWDRSPSGIAWSKDGKTLYLLAEENGRTALFQTSSNVFLTGDIPKKLFSGGAPSDIQPLKNGKIFVSGTSLIDNSAYSLYDPSSTNSSGPTLISSNSKSGSAFGLSRHQVDEITYKGAEVDNHAWVLKPSNFEKGKKYPLAFLIHGGPQGSWGDSWSTRWNPAVFAEQGYVVVTPNPTGSTGYGQNLTDAIQDQWGGLPYEDLVKAFEYIEEHLEYVDTDKAVALGASYGGYMINWIQGQDLGRKFKALVCHDGAFNIAAQLASDELYFPFHEFGGSFWENQSGWTKWDPSRFTENWATPQLVIHSDKDYRLTIAEGLAAFNVLQTKGVDSQFLTFPDENHWVLQPENSLLWHKVVLDFINKHVGLPSWGAEGPAADVLKEALVVDGHGAKL